MKQHPNPARKRQSSGAALIAAIRCGARQVLGSAVALACCGQLAAACNESRLVVVFDQADAGTVKTGGADAGQEHPTGGNTGQLATGGTTGQSTTGGTPGQTVGGNGGQSNTIGGAHAGGSGPCLLDDSSCTDSANCCSGNCALIGNALTCIPARGCGSRGDTCTSDHYCCSESCDTITTFTCRKVSDCRIIGESCASSGECCSGACADSGHNRLTCQPLSGCRPKGEICKQDSDCCTQNCSRDPVTGVGTCALIGSCAPVGEVCGIVPQAAYCCDSKPSGGPNSGSWCSMTLTGTPRCSSNQGAPSGAACSIPEQCSRHYCLPDLAGNLSCADKCADNGEPCRASSDCCSGQCSEDRCKNAAVQCQQIGVHCMADRECCSTHCGPTDTCVLQPDNWM
jgi:hypothetical protein